MNRSPIIIVGMHRSGTTMLSKLIEQAGVFLGRKKENNNEPLAFIRMNEWILRNANSSWDCPEMFDYADSPFLDDMANAVIDHMAHGGLRKFAGRSRARLITSDDAQFQWGWKDPRTSITLPVWQRVFPEGRFVHVYRNPFDVAASLRKRSLAIEPDNSRFARWKVRHMLGRVKYHESLRVRHIEEGLKLWEIYTARCLAIKNATVHHVKYEDFLAEPESEWEKLCKFLGLETPLTQLDFKGDISRAYAYKQDSNYEDAFNQFSGNPLVRQLGY